MLPPKKRLLDQVRDRLRFAFDGVLTFAGERRDRGRGEQTGK
jgi:hypothetical protein